MEFILDYKSIVIERFKDAVYQVEWRKSINMDYTEQLIEGRTYHGLLIQFGMSLEELSKLEDDTKDSYLIKENERNERCMEKAMFELQAGGYD